MTFVSRTLKVQCATHITAFTTTITSNLLCCKIFITLIRGFQTAGNHSVAWNETDKNGNPANTGSYCCHLKNSDDFEVTETMILLLDEPVASVDHNTQESFFNLLRELNRTITIVLVTHDVGAVSAHVKNIACIARVTGNVTCYFSLVRFGTNPVKQKKPIGRGPA